MTKRMFCSIYVDDAVISLATQGTDKVTAKITYVLLVKTVTDEPIKSPNFYRWISKKALNVTFFISFLLHCIFENKEHFLLVTYFKNN